MDYLMVTASVGSIPQVFLAIKVKPYEKVFTRGRG